MVEENKFMRIRIVNYKDNPNLIRKLELRIESADDWQYLTKPKAVEDSSVIKSIYKLLERVAGKDK